MPKPRLTHLEKRKLKMDRIKNMERLKSTHDWIVDTQYNYNGILVRGMYKTLRCCKRCGISYYQFQGKPVECGAKVEKVVEEDIHINLGGHFSE